MNWNKSAIFAGEDVDCIITFTNKASVLTEESREQNTLLRSELGNSQSYNHKRNTVTQSQNPGTSRASDETSDSTQHTQDRSQKKAYSLGRPNNSSMNGSPSRQVATKTADRDEERQKHGRSVSITSIGTNGERRCGSRSLGMPVGSRKNHGRSASLHFIEPDELGSRMCMFCD